MEPGKEFLRSIFEVAHVEFQSYDLHAHKLLFSSGVAHKLLGYSADEYLQLSKGFYDQLIHPDDKHIVRETLDKLIHSQPQEIVTMTVRARKNDGSYIWLYSRQMITERDDDCNICTIVRESEDVTKCVELQEQLRQKVEQLETISYKNSHLLRSPVASIIGLVNLIEENHIVSEHNIQIFSFMKTAIEKLDAIVHEINGVAKQ